MLKSNLSTWLSRKKIVVIHWLDAASKDEWHDPKDVASSQECVTVGVLTGADKHCVSITHTFGITNGIDDSMCCEIAIPQGCILDAYELTDRSIKKAGRRKP